MILTGNSHVKRGLNMGQKSAASVRNHPARATGRTSARDRIFDTACDLFYRKGIRAVGVETIANEAHATKMSLYRSFPSKDELVAEWLRRANSTFWQHWDEMLNQRPNNPRRQLSLIFDKAAEHVADPDSRGCPIANAAVELTDPRHPARKVIEEHKAELRARIARLCKDMAANDPNALADGLFLLMEGAQTSTQSLGHSGPGRSIARAAEALIDAHTRNSK